jgi:glycosyltransferase involved in cell wall biosynthesis
VLFVGTVEPRKGLSTLVQAMELLDRPDVTLAIAGPDGWGEDLARRLAATATPVVRLGFVPESDLALLRRGAALCCAPSRAEGFGLPVLEALAAGAAVVTTADTAQAEVAGDAAVLVAAGDHVALAAAIGRVLDDPALAASLRIAARTRAAEFSWQRCASQMVDVYRRAMEHPR